MQTIDAESEDVCALLDSRNEADGRMKFNIMLMVANIITALLQVWLGSVIVTIFIYLIFGLVIANLIGMIRCNKRVTKLVKKIDSYKNETQKD